MPKFADATLSQAITASGSSFKFSGTRPDNLGATEYTLATLVIDESQSVEPFADELLDMLHMCFQTCKDSPRAENLLLRVTSFNRRLKELHGFRQLSEIDPMSYAAFRPNATTALYRATTEAIAVTANYAKLLKAQSYDCNAVVFVVTDGMNYDNPGSPQDVAAEIKAARRGEALESLQVVLIGINTTQPEVATHLKTLQKDGEIDRYIDAGNVTPELLAQLADFMSSSILTQSQSLGSGKASAPIGFKP